VTIKCKSKTFQQLRNSLSALAALIVVASLVNAADLVSFNSAGTNSGNAGLSSPFSISPDGRFVLFQSDANNLVTNDTNSHTDVFVRDLQTGSTVLVSVNNAGTSSGNGRSTGAVISSDGRFVAFSSSANDLVPNDTNGTFDVFVRDLQLGTTTLVSLNDTGTASANGSSQISTSQAISDDGRFVVFTSRATDILSITDANATDDVFVRGIVAGTTTLISVNSAGTGTGNGQSFRGVISADGKFVAFDSRASDLVGTDTNFSLDVFLRDLLAGTTSMISVNNAGTNSARGVSMLSIVGRQAISDDGRFVAFESTANDLVAVDTNEAPDVFVRDRQAGTTMLASVNGAGSDSGNSVSDNPFLSGDGKFLAFTSYATIWSGYQSVDSATAIYGTFKRALRR
jgi:Tol biopolymer transport system component